MFSIPPIPQEIIKMSEEKEAKYEKMGITPLNLGHSWVMSGHAYWECKSCDFMFKYKTIRNPGNVAVLMVRKIVNCPVCGSIKLFFNPERLW